MTVKWGIQIAVLRDSKEYESGQCLARRSFTAEPDLRTCSSCAIKHRV